MSTGPDRYDASEYWSSYEVSRVDNPHGRTRAPGDSYNERGVALGAALSEAEGLRIQCDELQCKYDTLTGRVVTLLEGSRRVVCVWRRGGERLVSFSFTFCFSKQAHDELGEPDLECSGAVIMAGALDAVLAADSDEQIPCARPRPRCPVR